MAKTIFRKGNTLVNRRVVLERVSADTNFAIPAQVEIERIYLRRTSSADTTGGIRIGTAAGGAQLLAAVAVATQNLPQKGTVVSPLISLSGQTLYISTATAWNGAVIDVVIEYRELGESLPLVVSDSYATGQQGKGYSAY